MSNFGGAQEAGQGYENKLYTGVENFKVTALNPTHDELKKIYGDNAKEPTYVGSTEEGNAQVRLDFYLDNEPEEGEERIKTKMSLFLVDEYRTSQTGKVLYINAYGQNAWLKDGDNSGNMSWFDSEGKREAFRGEVELIDFLRNLLNLPSKTKAKDPNDAKSSFEEKEIRNILAGNVAALKTIIESSPNKIGLLLGVKTTDDGKVYQDVYTRSSVRQWVKGGKGDGFKYLREDVEQAQQNGAYSKTSFGNPDFVLREWDEASSSVASNDSAISMDIPSESPFANDFIGG